MESEDRQLNLPKREEKILEFWEQEKIFEKTLAKTKGGKLFVFYEGPPTANGSPGIHHFEARAFKDIIPRYKTMRGFYVPRKAGWDTHGLPVELQVEKELGLKHKRDIERYGIAAFNEKCRESVWRYKEEWDRFTKRIGFWLDLGHPYITYETSYMETLWWIIKEIWKKGFLYRDFKIVPWCPRCETGLSSHEVGQPGAYKKVKDNSVFVRMKIIGKPKESLLVWTTTPWTLPANVAVAVNPKIEYMKWKFSIQYSVPSGGKNDHEYIWSATTPPYDPKVSKPEIVEKASGAALVGIQYEPLYPRAGIPYKVVGADFVETEEGTGFVHLAPAFGEEDMAAMKKEYLEGYPILETVNPNGTMKKGVIGEGKFIKDADTTIVEDLKKRNLLFAVAPYEHDYPHCWRCATPLLYYAKNSWWIRTTAVKKEFIKNNQSIDWIPEHIKEGRFGEFLRELRDWAFSRERYWGTPLPIWECVNCHEVDAVGSTDELALRTPQSGNTYFAMRHGEAETQILGIAADSNSKYHLTDKGKKQVAETAERLKKEKFDIIIHSDVKRTTEAADILSKILGVKTVITDPRIHEVNVGVFDGKPVEEYHAFYSSMAEKFVKPTPKGESLNDLKKRLMDFMEDIEARYSNKKILILSHEYPIWILDGASRGLDNEGIIGLRGKRNDYIGLAGVIEVPYKKLPRDTKGEVNLHRPYIDKVEIICNKCGHKMKRVEEVIDVWFDSGAMPFAQSHWPFNKKEKLAFPADFISEAVDQTRGWFYTLLAVATLLGKKAPYRHVISLGHVLDKNGQKMSKSKGNVVDPWEMVGKYGADTIRWYFYTVNPAGEPKRFDEKDVQNKLRGVLSTFWNSFVLFDTYVDKVRDVKFSSKNILDLWIAARLKEMTREMTVYLDRYDVVGAARILEEFLVGDFSNWYLRRSRRRFQKPENAGEKYDAASTTARALLVTASLFAPFTPFIAEALWQELGRKTKLPERSVHLSAWPDLGSVTKEENKLIADMKIVRELVALALALRAKAGVKVRQPLSKLEVPKAKFQALTKDLTELIKDEVNVKEISGGDSLRLDIVITEALREEGLMRELLRNIQEMRRDLGLRQIHKIKLQMIGNGQIMGSVTRWKQWLMKEAGAETLAIGGKKNFKAERELLFDGSELWVGIEKID